MFAIIVMLFGGDVTGQLQLAPPRDLASLLDPKAALQQMDVPTDEDALIALIAAEPRGVPDLTKAVAGLGAEDFKTRQEAARILREAGPAARAVLEPVAGSDDPEVRETARVLLKQIAAAGPRETGPDNSYVQHLMAIRLLEQMKSRKAILALQTVAHGDDVTLAAAAVEAVAAINGKPTPRPSGRESLEQLAGRLPTDTAFLAVLDLERGAKARTIREFFELVKAAAKAGGGAAPEPDPDGPVTPDMLAQAVAQLDMVAAPQLERGVMELLNTVGNVRIDAVAMILPGGDDVPETAELPDVEMPEAAPETGNQYVAWVFKGLYDPERMKKGLAHGFRKTRTAGGHEILYGDGAVCLLDENTILLANGGGRDCPYMDALVEKLTSPVETQLPDVPAMAIESIRKGDMRLALASTWALGGALKAKLRQQVQRDLLRQEAQIAANPERAKRPAIRVGLAFEKLVLTAMDLDYVTGEVPTNGDLVLRGMAKDAGAATAMVGLLNEAEESLRTLLKSRAHLNAPLPLQALLAAPDMRFWTSEAEGRAVIVRGGKGPGIGMLPVMLLWSRSANRLGAAMAAERAKLAVEEARAKEEAARRAAMAAEQAQLAADKAKQEAAARAMQEAKRQAALAAERAKLAADAAARADHEAKEQAVRAEMEARRRQMEAEDRRRAEEERRRAP